MEGPRRRHLPNWPLLVPALAGLALAGYLTVTAWVGGEPLYCGAGSTCDEVQGSRWGSLLGLPISFWGFLTYATIAWVALRVRNGALHWYLSWSFALLGVSYSVYLTVISSAVLQALCAYCLASLALLAVLLVVATVQKPAALPGFSWPSWLLQIGGAAAVLIVVLHLHYSGVFTSEAGPEDPYLKGLAIHLSQNDFQFYGASWCGVCARQKAMFGASAKRLPYVECSPGGRGAPPNPECALRDVRSFPTWFAKGRRVDGLLGIEQLAAMSNYTGPAR